SYRAVATTERSPLSLHDALPIFDDIPPAPPWVERKFTDGKWTEWTLNPFLAPSLSSMIVGVVIIPPAVIFGSGIGGVLLTILAVDRKSTRLNSSHVKISYAVFCF